MADFASIDFSTRPSQQQVEKVLSMIPVHSWSLERIEDMEDDGSVLVHLGPKPEHEKYSIGLHIRRDGVTGDLTEVYLSIVPNGLDADQTDALIDSGNCSFDEPWVKTYYLGVCRELRTLQAVSAFPATRPQ